jgi:hypothetical protein
MSEEKQKPNWLKSRKQSLKGKVQNLYTFPEGTTLVFFNPDLEPESKKIEGKLKSIYTVQIDDETQKFAPSKTLERMMIAEFEKGNWALEITRQGLLIDNTTYTVCPHQQKKK